MVKQMNSLFPSGKKFIAILIGEVVAFVVVLLYWFMEIMIGNSLHSLNSDGRNIMNLGLAFMLLPAIFIGAYLALIIWNMAYKAGEKAASERDSHQ